MSVHPSTVTHIRPCVASTHSKAIYFLTKCRFLDLVLIPSCIINSNEFKFKFEYFLTKCRFLKFVLIPSCRINSNEFKFNSNNMCEKIQTRSISFTNSYMNLTELSQMDRWIREGTGDFLLKWQGCWLKSQNQIHHHLHQDQACNPRSTTTTTMTMAILDISRVLTTTLLYLHQTIIIITIESNQYP